MRISIYTDTLTLSKPSLKCSYILKPGFYTYINTTQAYLFMTWSINGWFTRRRSYIILIPGGNSSYHKINKKVINVRVKEHKENTKKRLTETS